MSSSNSFINLNQYTVVKSIGEGSYGYVFLVKDRNTQKIYAAKSSKEEIVGQNEENPDDLLFLFREIKIMSALNHPSIIQYIGYNPKNFDGKPNPTIVTEYASNGTLGRIIQLELSRKPPMNWDDTKKLICIYGIASGMSYLHQNNVIHRDLKPDNILIDENFCPKITDFGLSKITESIYASLNIQSQDGSKGSPLFMAPEIMCEEAYSRKSDVYAFSMIVYILITGQYPFSKVRNIVELMKKLQTGQRPTIPSDTPQAYVQLIERCWSQDVDERPSFDEIVNELKTNEDFLSINVDKNEFKKFVNFIDNYKTSFDISKSSFHFNNFISSNDDKNKENKEVKATSIQKVSTYSNIEYNEPPKEIKSADVHQARSVSVYAQNEPPKEIKSADVHQAKSASFGDQKNQPKEKIKKSHTMMLPQTPPLLNNENAQKPLSNMKADIKLKVTFVGDIKSGKQKLIYHLMNKPIPLETATSDGNFELVHEYFKEFVKFELVDTSGQEDFILRRVESYKNTNIFIFVFSLIDKETLKSIVTKWKDDISKYKENAISILVGVDLEKWSDNKSNQYVTQSEIEEAEQTTSAKVVLNCSYTTGENIDKLKNKMIESYAINFYQKEENDDEQQKKDSTKKKKKSKKDFGFKVLIVGNNNSGQSELLDYIENGKVSNTKQLNPLRRVDKKVSIHGKKVNLNLFGTPGQEDLQAIRLLAYKNTNVVLLVFSLIKKETFHALLRKYLKEVKSFANDAAVILVGVDLEKWEKNDYNRDFVHEAELQIVNKDTEVQQVLLCSYVTGENLDKISEKIIETYQMKTNDKSCNIA